MIIGFDPYICLHRSVNWWLKTVIVHTDFVFTFCLIACSSASCTKSGNFWTLRLGTLENNHNTPGWSISFQFCRKLTKHLLYHIANFDGGTQSVIWSVICIFMKSTSCSSGCAPSPWTWSVLHITGVFSVSSQYTIHRTLQHLHCLGNVRYCSPRCFHPNDLPSLADGTFPHDKVKLPSHKKLTFGVAKVVLVSTVLFKDYKAIFTHFCQTCCSVNTHHIDIFSGRHSMSNTMKNMFETLFHGPLAQNCADRVFLDCFTVSIWTGIRLSLGLYCVTSCQGEGGAGGGEGGSGGGVGWGGVGWGGGWGVGGGGGWGTSGQVSEVFRKSCTFHGFVLFLYIYTLLTRANTTFSRCLPAWNSFRCMRRPGRPPRTLPTSLARTNTSGERFFQARRRTRRRCGPPSSTLAGPAGPVTFHQDPSSDAPSPALAGPTALWGLLTTLRTSASGLSHVGPTACRCGPIPRPGHTAVTSSQALPDLRWPWHPSKRSYSSTRS